MTGRGIEPRLVKVADAADALGISTDKVRKLCDAGHLESKYQGRLRFVVVASLDRYVERLTAYPEGKAS